MKDINIGEVWYVNFPFSENDGRFKHRPSIIMEDMEDGTYRAIECTSKDITRSPFDYKLKNYKKANLVSNGRVRCDQIGRIAIRHFRKKQGEIDRIDMEEITPLYQEAIKSPNFRELLLEEFLIGDGEPYPINEEEHIVPLNNMVQEQVTKPGYSFLEILDECVNLQKVSEKDKKDIMNIYNSLSDYEKLFPILRICFVSISH